MSPCPKDGTKGQHLYVLASWETGLATVQHRCPTCGLEWSEVARDPIGAVRAALGLHPPGLCACAAEDGERHLVTCPASLDARSKLGGDAK